MPALTRPQKITFAEIRADGVRDILVCCSDHRCSHSVAQWQTVRADDLRLSDIEPRFTCRACGPPRRRRQAGFAERGVAIPGPSDYVRAWRRSRELERCVKLSYTDTLSTELAGSTIRAVVTLFTACRLRRRWSGLGGWYNEMADTTLLPMDCAC
jgi:hypothetical protein